MCVVIGADGGKVVELPPFVVNARRVNNIQLELVLERIRLTWSPSLGTFTESRFGGLVRIVEIEEKEKEPGDEDDGIKSFKVVATTIVNGYVVVTVQFYRADESLAAVRTYIFTGNDATGQGEYWYRGADGIWMGSPDFTPGSWKPGTLPPAKVTPPDDLPPGDGSPIGQN